MDRWEEGFDTWTPRGNEVPSEDTDTDVDREELLRLARELGARRQADHGQANDEVERLKQSLRERAEAVAARERELEELRRKLEAGRAPVLDRFRRSGADDEAVAARERAALERARALDERERAVEGRAGELAGEAERLAERERELEAELAAAQARLAETAAERELAERERERLEERDRAAHDVEKSLAATRIAIEQERERLEARERELAAQVRELEARAAVLGSAAVVETDTPESDAAARLAALDAREQELERLETKVEARERDLLLLRQGLDSERNALLERERALRRREVAEVRESFAPPLAPPSFSEGLAALARRTRG
jgi:chromosome segregation ATPase